MIIITAQIVVTKISNLHAIATYREKRCVRAIFHCFGTATMKQSVVTSSQLTKN